LILASAPIFQVIITTISAKSLPITAEYITALDTLRLVAAGFVASLGFIKKPAYHWSVLIGLFIAIFASTSAIIFELKL
jgi:hypothetical protein